MPRKVIGLVGPIASGKGIVVEILKQKGYSAYSLSDVLKTEVQKRGWDKYCSGHQGAAPEYGATGVIRHLPYKITVRPERHRKREITKRPVE